MKLANRIAPHLGGPRPPGEDDGVVVTLEHFAAIAGMTHQEYSRYMSEVIAGARVLDLLKPEARLDVERWMDGLPVRDGETFAICFRLTLNRRGEDLAMYCKLVRKGDLNPAEWVGPGSASAVPASLWDVPVFEINFCDLETRVR